VTIGSGRTGQKVELVSEAVLGSPEAVEVDRVVPPSGNLAVAGQQFWFGPRHAGAAVTSQSATTATTRRSAEPPSADVAVKYCRHPT
jgi:hypothetical protein